MTQFVYILVGILMGAFAGFLGVGGGLILIPILVYGFGLTQHQAQGTSLAVMIPPITLLAALRYYQNGNVKLGMAALIAAGFIIGGFFGAGLVARFETYAIEEKAGSGTIGLYGAAAHLGKAGDLVIILSYGLVKDERSRGMRLKPVYVDAKNRIVKRT